MENPSLTALLTRIGLHPKEIDVYLALLTLKSARASSIAKLARQSRSHTYLMLRSLEERGLIAEVERGKILTFIAEPPERLIAYIKDRKEELSSVEMLAEGALPMLKSLTPQTVDRPRVTLLHGMEGMKQVYRDVLPNTFCALFNPQSMYDAFGGNIVPMVLGKEARLRGRDLLVNTAATKRFIRENPQDDEYEIRVLPNNVTFATDTLVYEDRMTIFAYDTDRTIITIENRPVADSFRAWFKVLWAQGKKT